MNLQTSESRDRQLVIDAEEGWIVGARKIVSPNCDERPAGQQPELIVVHGISLPPGEFGGGWIEALFTNTLPAARHPYFAGICDLRVSAHVLINRNGELTQFVPFRMRAWHAGVSSYCGRAGCNDFSIGIELEGTDDSEYDAAQYVMLARLIKALLGHYPLLSPDAIVGHSDIAPGRKTDPGAAFDWHTLRRELAAGDIPADRRPQDS